MGHILCVTVQGVGLQKSSRISLPVHYDVMAQDAELTASSLKDIINERFGAENVKYRTRTIARICNELGWTF